MTRPKKGEKANNEAQLMIPVEEFMRTRDNVVTSLTTLQGAIGDLLRAYIAHTTSVLGGGSGTELSAVTQNILTSATVAAPVDEKKKKVRRKKDPNAPKAPPTAYFLYAQQARPLIKKDLGEDAKGDAVTMEASKRWNGMGEEEKDTWRNLYKTNFAVYKQQLATYNAEKAARGEATVEEEDIPEDADAIADAVAGAAPEEADAESASDDSSAASDSSEEEEEEKEPTPPPKPETPKKRGKAAKANGVSEAPAVKQTPVPLPAAAVAPEKTKSPEKRKKGAATEEAEEPKKKKGKKGKVAETVEESVEEPAPVTPEVKEKKRKRKDTKA